ncbi:MAG: UDP-N-acetylmuramoyl-tripeptide--D-alanyl-D-alanine ligase [Kiritimatiellae bacterium]|nr:UDP-N-acetylmuramoyl-tripeptide--D-alanyl-D-alanine ligase [Kiritimatiellia bacterium]
MLKVAENFRGATIDSRLVAPGMLFVALKGEKSDGRDFIPQALAAGASGVIEGLEELHSFAAAYRKSLRAKVIGVTGSAGKTTVKEMLKAFLSKAGSAYATEGNFNNHIGLPLSILNTPRDADFLVLEMGTNHPGEIAALCEIASPDAGAISSIGNAHIGFFGSTEGIAREKGTLFAKAKGPCVAHASVKHADILRSLAGDRYIEAFDDPAVSDAVRAVLPGDHNVSNAAVAFRAAAEFGVTREMAVAALGNFSLPGDRWKKKEKCGVVFIDDTYNANPDAMKAALAAFASMKAAGRRIAVLGDMFELGEKSAPYHAEVFDCAAESGLDAVYAVGEFSSACRCDAAWPDAKTAARALSEILLPGDTVLLKASHSMHLGGILEDIDLPSAG